MLVVLINTFHISQIVDFRNIVLVSNGKCIVLSSNTYMSTLSDAFLQTTLCLIFCSAQLELM